MRILILTNSIRPEYNFRRERIEAFLEAGHQVTIASPPGDQVRFFKELGCGHVESRIEQYSTNPLSELRVLGEYLRLLRRARPDVVITSSIKPNVWGGLAAQICGVPQIANVTGLGVALESEGLGRRLGVTLYSAGLRKVRFVNFQNVENRGFFQAHGIAAGREVRLSAGSGVNLDRFSYEPKPQTTGPVQPLRLLYVGRLQKAKGVGELLQLARRLKVEGLGIKVELLGRMVDDFEAEIASLEREGAVLYHGETADVRPYVAAVDAVILPSHHEGLANVLLEAAAMGRPVLAADIPGCRETFDEGVTGFGFKPGDVESMLGAVRRFCALDREEREVMGRKARDKMERQFDRQVVVDGYLDQLNVIEDELGAGA